MKQQKQNKKRTEFKSSYNITIKIIAGACAFLIFGSLFLSLLY